MSREIPQQLIDDIDWAIRHINDSETDAQTAVGAGIALSVLVRLSEILSSDTEDYDSDAAVRGKPDPRCDHRPCPPPPSPHAMTIRDWIHHTVLCELNTERTFTAASLYAVNSKRADLVTDAIFRIPGIFIAKAVGAGAVE